MCFMYQSTTYFRINAQLLNIIFFSVPQICNQMQYIGRMTSVMDEILNYHKEWLLFVSIQSIGKYHDS